ncbi:hypothetical protein VPH35_133326 [Triticum aestivum]
MGRLPKKVTLGYVRDDSTRRSRYKQRLKGLMKKAGELGKLCDVETCVVVYGEGEAAPEVFPSPDKAVGILNGFKSVPELRRCKKTMDQEGLLTERIAKLQEQVDKSRRECQDRETRYLLQQIMEGNLPGLVGLSVEQLARVGYKVEEMIKSMGERMGKTHSQALPPAPCVTTGIIDMGSPVLYQAPEQQTEGTLVGGYAGGHDGAGFTGGDTVMQMQSFNLEFGSSHFPPMYQAPPRAPWVTTGNGDMGSTALHQVPVQRQEGTLLSSGGDLGTLVYGGYAGGHEGAGFTGDDTMMQMQSFNLEFDWSQFPPM